MKNEFDLKELTTYRGAFATIKVFIIVFGICAFLFSAFVYTHSQNEIAKRESVNWVYKDNGNITQMQTFSLSPSERKLEYEKQVEIATKLWYAFDESSYDNNINKALYLFGECGKEMLKDYEAADIKRNLMQKSIQTELIIHQINIENTQVPIIGSFEGVQIIKRNDAQKKRSIIATFTIEDTDKRTKDNVHACKIENWKIIQSKNIDED